MYGQYRKADPSSITTLKHQGLTNTQIARRLGVTETAVGYTLNRTKSANDVPERLRS